MSDAAAAWQETLAAALVRYELMLLAQLGFGLDLEECAVTGESDGLTYVSPRSGRAVSEAGAGTYRDRLLRLPLFLTGDSGTEAGWDDIFDGLRLTGHFLKRDLFIERQAEVLAARERLVARLQAMAG